MPLFSYLYSRLALGALPSSIRWKKPSQSPQLFFAAAVWLVSSKRNNTLRIGVAIFIGDIPDVCKKVNVCGGPGARLFRT